MNLVERPWSAVFFAGFVVYVGIRHVYSERVKGVERVERRIDGLEKALLPVVAVGTMLLPLLYLFSPWFAFADYDLPTWAHGVGAAILAGGLLLFRRSHADLGLNWSISVESRRGHELVRTGVYARVRHPMYAAIFLFSLGQALLLDNWLAGWSALACFAPLYLVRTPRKERLMLDVFGDEYRAHMAETGRLWPRSKGPSRLGLGS